MLNSRKANTEIVTFINAATVIIHKSPEQNRLVCSDISFHLAGNY